MAESRPENPVKTLERAPEATPAKSPPEQKQVGRAAAEHGGLYAQFRDLTAANGGGEPPPEKFAPLFRRAEYSHPANEAARARALDALQQQYGNRYVQRVLAPADAALPSEPTIQRQASSAPADGAVGGALDRSTSQTLDPRTADFMAARFGRDFSDVRAHTDSAAGQAARAIGAEAFTAGRDVYFGQGTYDPASDRGRGLIAHELAHVVQHDRGLTDAAPHGFRVSRPDDPLERQAEAASRAVLRGEMLPPIGAAGLSGLYRQVRGGNTPAAPSAPAASAPGPAPASAGPGTGAAAARPTAAPKAGDFPISFAGSTLVLPVGDLLERAAPGGKLAVPDRIIKRVPSIPAFKLTGASVDLDDSKLPSGATVDVALNIPPVQGQGSLSVDKAGSASGSVHAVFSSAKIPGIRQVETDIQVKKDDFAFDLGLDFDLPKVTGRLDYKYRDHKHSGKGKANYDGAKLKGSLEMIMSEAGRVSGSGMLEMELFKGLRGQVDVAVDEKRNIAVKGKLTVPGQIELFPEKKYEKSFFTFEKKFPLWGFTIPVIDINVGLFAEIHAGAGFRAKFGPGVLRDIQLTGEFGTDPEAATEFGLGGEFFLPAGAEIVVNVGGGIGLGLAVADITGGIEAVGVAGVYTALTVRPQFKYAGGKYTISGMAELAGVAQVKFGINAFAKVDVGVWIFKGTVWRKDWTLAEWIWNTGLNVALRANISYTLGDDFAPDFSFETGQVDPEKFVKDVMPESGSPVPAPPKPAAPDKATFTAEGAQGQPASGAAPPAPAPPTPGSPPARTQAGTAPATAAPGARGPQAPGAAGAKAGVGEEKALPAKDLEPKLQGDVTQQLGQKVRDAAEVQAALKAVYGRYHDIGLKSLDIVEVPGQTGDFDVIATASPGKKVGRFEILDELDISDLQLKWGTTLVATMNNHAVGPGTFEAGNKKHAEEHLLLFLQNNWEQLKADGVIAPSGINTLAISINRSPCGAGKGRHNCARQLNQFVAGRSADRVSLTLRMVSMYGGNLISSINALRMLHKYGHRLEAWDVVQELEDQGYTLDPNDQDIEKLRRRIDQLKQTLSAIDQAHAGS